MWAGMPLVIPTTNASGAARSGIRRPTSNFLVRSLAANIQGFDFLPCPRGAAQKFEARGHAGIVGKALDFYPASHFFPAELLFKLNDDHL